MEITESLRREHEEVSGLFRQFFGGGTLTRLVNRVVGSRPPRRKAVATKICAALKMHTRLEEEIVYPDVRATGDVELNKLVDESLREHAGVKEKIAKAETLLGEDGALDETMAAIQGDVDHHVREEETEMFPLLHKVMSEQKLREIGRRYAARKRGLKGKPARPTARPAGRRPTKVRKIASAKRKTVRARATSAARRKTRPAPKRTGARGR